MTAMTKSAIFIFGFGRRRLDAQVIRRFRLRNIPLRCHAAAAECSAAAAFAA